MVDGRWRQGANIGGWSYSACPILECSTNSPLPLGFPVFLQDTEQIPPILGSVSQAPLPLLPAADAFTFQSSFSLLCVYVFMHVYMYACTHIHQVSTLLVTCCLPHQDFGRQGKKRIYECVRWALCYVLYICYFTSSSHCQRQM